LREAQAQDDKAHRKQKLEEALRFVSSADRVKLYQTNGLYEEAANWLVEQGQHKEAVELLLDSNSVPNAMQLLKNARHLPWLLKARCRFVNILASLKAKHDEMSKAQTSQPSISQVLQCAALLAKHNPEGFATINTAISKLLADYRMDRQQTHRTTFVTFYLRLIQAVFNGDQSLLDLLRSLHNQRSSYQVVVQQVFLISFLKAAGLIRIVFRPSSPKSLFFVRATSTPSSLHPWQGCQPKSLGF
jgi:hypothetical protein